jgi:hypothetical protein
VSPRFVRELERSGLSLGSAKDAIGQVLVTADAWRTWAGDTFTLLVTTAISYVTSALGTVTGALAQQAVRILDALRDMLRKAPAMLPQAVTKVQGLLQDAQRSLDDALVALGALTPEEAALRKVARTAGTHSRRAIRESVQRLAKGGVDTKTLGHISRMTNAVFDAFADPAAFAGAMKTIVDARRKVSATHINAELKALRKLREKVAAEPGATLATNLTPEAAAYVAAVKRLARERRTGVVELHKTGPDSVLLIRRDVLGNEETKPLTSRGGVIDADEFMNEVIAGGDLILDFAALEIGDQTFGTGAHGAMTHVLHDLVADKALKDAGFAGGAIEFRARMAWLQATWDAVAPRELVPDPDFSANDAWKAGTALWVGTYDRYMSLAQPERLWGALRPFLNMVRREL